MKFMMTTVIVVAFAVSGCKKDAAIDTSNNADSVAACATTACPLIILRQFQQKFENGTAE